MVRSLSARRGHGRKQKTNLPTQVAWVGDQTQQGLAGALTTWFGPPAAA
jgi:hypothetical protein